MATYIQIFIIAFFNFIIVGYSAMLTVNGNGTAGGVYWIQGVGYCWVIGFGVRALVLAKRGESKRAVHLAVATLLYAFVAGMLVTYLGIIVEYLWSKI